MNYYETVIIHSPDLPTETTTPLIEKLKSIILKDNGEIISVKEWGKRRLAYKISGYHEGIYIYIEFRCEGKAIRTLEDTLGLTEGILRYLTVKKKMKKQIIPKETEKQVVTEQSQVT